MLTMIKRTNEERNTAILKAWEVGGSATDIANTFGVSRSTVCGIVFRAREKGQAIARRNTKPRRKRKVATPELKVARRARRAEAILAQTWQPMTATVSLEMADAIVQLKTGQCRFPIDGDGKPFHFCKDKALDGSPYCLFHTDLTHRRVEDGES
jgi:hypothetical protein